LKIKKFSDLEKLPTSKKVILIVLLLLIFFSLYYLWSMEITTQFKENGVVVCEDIKSKGKFITEKCPQREPDYYKKDWIPYIEADTSWINT
jgi:hypothetical protein